MNKVIKFIFKRLDGIKYRFGFEENKLNQVSIQNEVVVIISHSDYLNSMGGTEKYIYEQIKTFKEKELIGAIQIFPHHKNFFLEEKVGLYGININENFLGYYQIDEILNFLIKNKQFLKKILIHHLMYWQFCNIEKLILGLGVAIKLVYYMHDFFSFTPSVYKIYTSYNFTQEQIYKVDEDYNIIDNLSSEEDIVLWKNKFNFILSRAEKVIVPSNYLKKIAQSAFLNEKDKFISLGHLKLTKSGEVNRASETKVRVAYLGYKSNLKGWNVWKTLYSDKELDCRYKFFHIGSQANYATNVSCCAYSFIDDGINAAVKLLEANEIDIVILWSIVPESYSYTMYESIASGVPIITNSRSGNIATVVDGSNSEIGIVFNDETQLYDFLKDEERVKCLINKRRNSYTLKFNYREL